MISAWVQGSWNEVLLRFDYTVKRREGGSIFCFLQVVDDDNLKFVCDTIWDAPSINCPLGFMATYKRVRAPCPNIAKAYSSQNGQGAVTFHQDRCRIWFDTTDHNMRGWWNPVQLRFEYTVKRYLECTSGAATVLNGFLDNFNPPFVDAIGATATGTLVTSFRSNIKGVQQSLGGTCTALQPCFGEMLTWL